MGENALVMVISMNNQSAEVNKYGAFRKCGASLWLRHVYLASRYTISKGPISPQLIRANMPSLKGPQKVLRAILTMAEVIVTARH